VHSPLIDSYYTPGTKLNGRCLYPFLQARVSFSGKVYFCPFIRVEVGDLATSSLEEIWNGERYVEMRKRLLDNGIFPVCRRCCKVELAPEPAVRTADLPRRRSIPLTAVQT
jgi:MoaA/NifB/PqqE/SkfB family radical SAM enzyme